MRFLFRYGAWLLPLALTIAACGASSDTPTGSCPDSICTPGTTGDGAGLTGGGGNSAGTGASSGGWPRDPLCGQVDNACDPDWNSCNGSVSDDAAAAKDGAPQDGTLPSDARAGDAATSSDATSGARTGLDSSASDAAPDSSSSGTLSRDASDAALFDHMPDGMAADDASGGDAPADGATTGAGTAALVANADQQEPTGGDGQDDQNGQGGQNEAGSQRDAAAESGLTGPDGSGALPDGGTAPPDTDAADASSATDGATQADGSEISTPGRACRVRAGSSGEPVAVCEPAGQSGEGDPCADSADCRAGLACVSDDSDGGTPTAPASSSSESEGGATGVCRPFCCSGSCRPGAVCSPRPLQDSRASSPYSPAAPLLVPVCTPANCRLLDPTSCPSGMTCSPIGSGATTACVPAGTAQPNDPCSEEAPCASGLVCVKNVNRCFELCHTESANACPAGTCQGYGDSLPPGFGLCISDELDAY